MNIQSKIALLENIDLQCKICGVQSIEAHQCFYKEELHYNWHVYVIDDGKWGFKCPHPVCSVKMKLFKNLLDLKKHSDASHKDRLQCHLNRNQEQLIMIEKRSIHPQETTNI